MVVYSKRHIPMLVGFMDPGLGDDPIWDDGSRVFGSALLTLLADYDNASFQKAAEKIMQNQPRRKFFQTLYRRS